MQAARNASFERTRQQSMTLLNRHLVAAVILQDRMRRSPRNLMGANFIMIDDMCDQVASLMETCTMLIADRLNDLGGKVLWPVLLDEAAAGRNVRDPGMAGLLVNGLSGTEPLDAFGQSVLEAVAVAEAYGDTTTAGVMEQIWRGVDRQLWILDVQEDSRQ